MKHMIIIALFFVINHSLEAQFINFDLDSNLTMDIKGRSEFEGAKFNLSNSSGTYFLRLSSVDGIKNTAFPTISRPATLPLVIGTQGKSFQEQLRIGADGALIVPFLATGRKQNLIAAPDGTLLVESSELGYSKVVVIHYSSFNSVVNPELVEVQESKYYAYHEQPIGLQIEWLQSAVPVPHGSIIRRIDIDYYDNDGSKDILFGIFRQRPGFYSGPNAYLDFTVLGRSMNNSDTIRTISIVDLNYEINQVDYSELFQIRGYSSHGMTWNWPSDNAGIQKVTIYYD